MDDDVDPLTLERGLERAAVGEIDLAKDEIRRGLGKRPQPCRLERDVVVVIEIVDADDEIAAGSESDRCVVADEPGYPGNEDSQLIPPLTSRIPA